MPTVADQLLSRLREWGVEQVFGYPGDGINGILGAFSRADDQPRFVQSRHEEMSAFEAVGYAKFGGRPGVCMATSGPGRDPSAQRALRRQARPRAGGGDRRPDQPHGDGRQLPAGGRPAQPVQGRRQRLRADGDRARAAAQPGRPGDADRHDPARADGADHPQRRPGAGVRRARRTRSRWSRPASASDLAADRRPTPTACAGRPSCSTPAAGSPCSSGRAPAAPTPSSREVADLLGAGVAKALLGKDVLQRRAAVGHRVDRPARDPAELRDDARLRHPADRRVELPLHPVPARARTRPAPSRSTSTAR